MTNWKVLASHKVEATPDQFWNAIEIFNNRPHIVNRQLIGAEVLLELQLINEQQISEVLNQLKLIKASEITKYDSDSLEKHITLQDVLPQEFEGFTAFIKRLLPRSSNQLPRLEMTVYDYKKTCVTFANIICFGQENLKSICPEFQYCVTLKDGELIISIEENVLTDNPSSKWLKCHVLSKLVNWIEKSELGTRNFPSLRLVPLEKYLALYQRLKNDYGKKIVKMWPETTDPLKFVYEDVAIAAYLLQIWGTKPQQFVDLGCGNGLLVHILNCEGHLGIGYDLKPRRIWKMYPDSTRLEVKCITPSDETVFPEADWLIGNHSDELTLWIPVMAARSSYKCKFFVLPCCPYEFDGRKYQRTNTSVSQYSDYLNYVESVCYKCGIKTEKDKLRIPSTRRTCFIGTDRVYQESGITTHNEELKAFVTSKSMVTELSNDGGTNETWCSHFKPRSEEKVRNCTQLEKSLIDSIVNVVAEQLLTKKRFTNDDDKWNRGGILDIGSIAKLISFDNLKKLKNECGGLQTLLKNNRHIFKVESGKVELRKPTEQVQREHSWKLRPCWFFHNHPDSCPVQDEKCSFKH